MELKEKIAKAEVACLYFKGAGCTVCSYLEPKVKELIEGEFPKMDYIVIQSEEEPELAADYRVFSAPVIIVLFDGRETIRKGRTASIPELQQEIDRYYQMYFSE